MAKSSWHRYGMITSLSPYVRGPDICITIQRENHRNQQGVDPFARVGGPVTTGHRVMFVCSWRDAFWASAWNGSVYSVTRLVANCSILQAQWYQNSTVRVEVCAMAVQLMQTATATTWDALHWNAELPQIRQTRCMADWIWIRTQSMDFHVYCLLLLDHGFVLS